MNLLQVYLTVTNNGGKKGKRNSDTYAHGCACVDLYLTTGPTRAWFSSSYYFGPYATQKAWANGVSQDAYHIESETSYPSGSTRSKLEIKQGIRYND